MFLRLKPHTSLPSRPVHELLFKKLNLNTQRQPSTSWSMGEEEEIRAKIRYLCVRCSFVFGVLVLYLTLGGGLFYWLEHKSREDFVQEAIEELEEDRAELLNSLWAHSISKKESDWSYLANQRMDLYEKRLKGYLLQGVDLQDEDPDNPWTFIGATFYCFTVITTIGYGNLFPATILGKLLTIVYAVLGIPLTLYYLAEIGKLLTLVLKLLLRKRWAAQFDSSDEFNFTPLVAVGVTLVYLLLGGVLFDALESDWGLVESIYFSFVSFSTIGFGDLVPEGQGYMLLLMVYCLSALSLCGMCFVVIQNAAENFLIQKQEDISGWWRSRRRKRSEARAKRDDSRSRAIVRPPSDIVEEEVEVEEVNDEEIEDLLDDEQ